MTRKSQCSEANVGAICDAIASGSSLREACGKVGIATTTFLYWVDHEESVAEQYARARAAQNEAVDDELRKLAEEVTPETARAVETKFRIATWIAGKRAPKRFGDRLGLEHSGKDGGPLKIEVEMIGGE